MDFRNLNKSLAKDNYHAPSLDEVLQIVNGSKMMSFLDGCFGYNQTLVDSRDRMKTAFTMKWGTFAYKRMPFGLINIGSTFQRSMDITFQGLIGKCIIIYMDDLIIFSKDRSQHVKHLEVIFERCRRYGISLNLKIYIFFVTKGKLFGHVINKEGITVDPNRIQSISKLPFPNSKKELKSFFGKINFVQKIIFGFAEIVKPLNMMLKKEAKVEWTPITKVAFREIKEVIMQVLILVSLDFSQDFYVYSFSSNHTIVVVLIEKRDSEENPISFMSANLKEAELNYSILDKQDYALVKVVKTFIHYILRNKVHAIVPYPTVKLMLGKNELGERRGKWMAKLQEFDLDIQAAKIVRGQGIARAIA